MICTKTLSSGPLRFSAYLATLFLGALNDNVCKMLVICFGTQLLGTQSAGAATFMSLAAAMFLLPYLLFSAVAGYLADRYSKRSVMIICKAAEIVIMGAGFMLAHFGGHASIYWMLPILFFMGAQSTFFAPAKYGFLPETQSIDNLSRANGLTQLFTFLAIIIGGYVGGFLEKHYHNGFSGGLLWCVIIAILGYAASIFIPQTPPGNHDSRLVSLDPFTPIWATFRKMAKDHLMLSAVLGNSFFWFIGAMVQLLIVPLAQNTLHGDSQLVGNLQGFAALGIGLGCSLAGLASKRRIAYGRVAPGALAMAICAAGMAIGADNTNYAYLFIFGLGISSGFFQLPLSTAIQHLSPENERGRYQAVCSALDCVTMLLSSIAMMLMRNLCHLQAPGIAAVMSFLLLAASLVYFKSYRKLNP